jgi:hypothetical protein
MGIDDNRFSACVLGLIARLAAPVARPARVRPTFAAAAEQPAEAAE